MNDIVAMFILAVVQGIAEWIPISSSAHLVLVSKIIGYENTLAFDVALHFGTLMAVFVYFGKDITEILRDLFRGKFNSPQGRLGVLLAIATVPVGVAGLILHTFLRSSVDNLALISLGLGITGLILFIGSCSPKQPLRHLGYKGALLVGLAQILALFRGVSRSGSTISTGLLLGLSEKDAVKFSFLLSIPVIFGANLLIIGNNTLPPSYFGAAFVSFLVGISTIHFSFNYILSRRENLRWFGAYTLLLAAAILIYLFFF